MKKTQNEVTVGAFVIIGFIMLALIVFFVSGVYVFRPGYYVTVNYNYVDILDKGAPVRMAGVRVGEVNRVSLTYDEKEKRAKVLVKLFIEKGVEIRDNYSFEIRGTHVLSEPHIEISPKPGDASVVQDGAMIQGVNPVPVEALIDRAHVIVAHMEAILKNLQGALEAKETGEAIKRIILNMDSITISMRKVLDGSEGDLKSTIGNLKNSTDSLQDVLGKVHSGEGTVGALLMKDQLYKDLSDFVADGKSHPRKLFKKKIFSNTIF